MNQIGGNNIVLECQEINHWFGDFHVLHDVNLKVQRGEIAGLVGPSGCGKTTLLRSITGTHPPCRGSVIVHSNNGSDSAMVITKPSRDIGIVYQQYSLFPFLTAQENVAFGLMLDQTGIPFRFFKPFSWRKLRKEHMQESAELLEKFGLGEAMNRYPSELSGGMKQRVAIAQALIMKPEILLLDEPFGALDEATREEMQRMLLTLYAENCQALENNQAPPYTVLIVTHELREAIFVSDRVVGLSQYWDWRKEGYQSCPGATIVYDQVAPVFGPDQNKDHIHLDRQRDEIRMAVFDPQHCQAREEFRKFWEQVRTGQGGGVLENGN